MQLGSSFLLLCAAMRNPHCLRLDGLSVISVRAVKRLHTGLCNFLQISSAALYPKNSGHEGTLLLPHLPGVAMSNRYRSIDAIEENLRRRRMVDDAVQKRYLQRGGQR